MNHATGDHGAGRWLQPQTPKSVADPQSPLKTAPLPGQHPTSCPLASHRVWCLSPTQRPPQHPRDPP